MRRTYGRFTSGIAALALACASGTPQSEAAADIQPGAPVLSRVRPDTIPLGQGAVPTLTLTGSGFAPGGAGAFAGGQNTLHVGRATFDRVPADSAGTTITFALPLTYTDTVSRGRPSSFSPGTYDVSVRTARGVSNALTLTMIR